MDQIPIPEELEGTGQLLEEVSDDDLIESAHSRIGVLGYHIAGVAMVPQRFPPLDEQGQVSQGAVFHDQMDVRGGLMAVDERDDVGVVEAFENVDLRGQIVLELLVEFRQVDRLDGDVGAMFLSDVESV